jgi:predicted RNA-binding protein YlqC (UPF0109 family)
MLKNFIEYVVKQLVNDKDAVVVTQQHTDIDSKQIVEIRVTERDFGKVIGKGGTTIRSIRSIVSAIGAMQGIDIVVEVVK